MSELIEKQKVLDALREIATEKFSLDDPYGVYINVLMDVEEKICHLPVVQPNGPDNLVKDSQGLAKDLVNDCISRKAAIDAVHEEFNDCLVWDESGKSTADEFEIIINRLPSVQSESKKGKWIEAYDPFNRISGRCSVCGWEAHLYEDDVVGMNYCPNCGADMRGEQDE